MYSTFLSIHPKLLPFGLLLLRPLFLEMLRSERIPLFGMVLLFVVVTQWISDFVADVAPIRIGSNTHLCDNVVVHVDSPPNQLPAIIGSNCVIGSNCIVHACTIEDNCLIGEGSTVLDGAHICKGAAVAPGSVVTPRKTVPAGELWSGVPARELRDLTSAEQEEILSMCAAYAAKAAEHCDETSKSCEQLMVDVADAEDKAIRDLTNAYNANPNGVNPHRRGLIYDRLPPEFDDPEEAPAVVHRPDAHELRDLSYDVVETDEQDFANLPHLPDHELKCFVC